MENGGKLVFKKYFNDAMTFKRLDARPRAGRLCAKVRAKVVIWSIWSKGRDNWGGPEYYSTTRPSFSTDTGCSGSGLRHFSATQNHKVIETIYIVVFVHAFLMIVTMD